jgi:hypothetical protein
VSTPPELQEKLDAVNEEFHAVIEEKGHCYSRAPGEDDTCHCAYYWDLWLTVRADYERTK